MRDAYIKEHADKDHRLVVRRKDGTEEVLYQGASYCECLFMQRRYEASHPDASAEQQRDTAAFRFMGFYLP